MNPGPYAAQAQFAQAPPAATRDDPFASVSTLGARSAVYPATRASQLIGPILGGLMLFGSLASIATGGMAALAQLDRRRGDPIGVFVPWLGIAIALLALAGILGWVTWRNWKIAAATFEGGVASFDRKGLRVVTWTDVTHVYQHIVRQYVNGVYTGTHYTYTLDTRLGRIKFDGRYQNVEALGKEIQRRVTGAMAGRAVAAYENGQRVDFGPVAVDKSGLHSRGKSLPWSEVQRVKIENGFVSVAKQGKWLNWVSAPVHTIPNFFVLLALLDRIGVLE